MTNYARIADGIVQEVIEVPEGLSIVDMYHPDLVSALVACADEVEQGWTYDGKIFAAYVAPAPNVDQLKATKLVEIDAKISEVLSVGAPVSGGLHASLDDSSRADMSAMATTALAASSAVVAWPDSYKEGWISIENTRITLPTPADGLSLAAAVGDYYAKVRQNGRTLKDTVNAATTIAALNAIDPSAGWPAA
jgi:hypothetical protein